MQHFSKISHFFSFSEERRYFIPCLLEEEQPCLRNGLNTVFSSKKRRKRTIKNQQENQKHDNWGSPVVLERRIMMKNKVN